MEGVTVEALKIVLAKSMYPLATTRQVCEQVILPATLEDNISYAELLSRDPALCHLAGQEADVFVSHAWDYPLSQVIDAIEV